MSQYPDAHAPKDTLPHSATLVTRATKVRTGLGTPSLLSDYLTNCICTTVSYRIFVFLYFRIFVFSYFGILVFSYFGIFPSSSLPSSSHQQMFLRMRSRLFLNDCFSTTASANRSTNAPANACCSLQEKSPKCRPVVSWLFNAVLTLGNEEVKAG